EISTLRTLFPSPTLFRFTDCRTAFRDDEALPTSILIERLKAEPESPWPDYGNTGLTPMRLGALLREYEIRSATIRFAPPTGQAKGYTRSSFEDAWSRYCPSGAPPGHPESSQPYQPSQARPGPGRLETWDGLSRTTNRAVPGLNSTGTAGTAGTGNPRLFVVEGAA
ncbi:MAG TPA: hypothetical protein DGG94_03670, partial [Micromonosporaceae bacterium]|nr:hypothetical protein [Micromonosporaceae bacterium]